MEKTAVAEFDLRIVICEKLRIRGSGRNTYSMELAITDRGKLLRAFLTYILILNRMKLDTDIKKL
jgi:hypothetical protein